MKNGKKNTGENGKTVINCEEKKKKKILHTGDNEYLNQCG